MFLKVVYSLLVVFILLSVVQSNSNSKIWSPDEFEALLSKYILYFFFIISHANVYFKIFNFIIIKINAW